MDHLRDRSKQSFLIYGPGNSSDECEILVGFSYKYSRIKPTKEQKQEPETKNKFGRQQDNNAIVQHAVNYISMQDKNIKCER